MVHVLSRRVRWVVLLLLAFGVHARGQLRDADFVAICGDSITEQKLYSVFIENYLLMCQPANKLGAMQFGWSGETSWAFAARLANDVLPYKPTVATTCYGMNDGGYAPLNEMRAARFRDSTKQIIESFKQAGVRFIVIGSPGAVDTVTFKRTDPSIYNRTLAQLRDIAREVATENGVAFADVHTPMLEAMEKAKAKLGPDYDVCGRDGFHPGANGHLIMAYAFLKALGCDGNIGTIRVDLAAGNAEATEGHQILSAANGVVEVVSERYPYCFSGDPASSDSTRGIVEFFPFNQDLNRYMLVVNNPGAEKLKITWGNTTRGYSAAELARGINLAAEFMDNNPFSESFARVEQAIRAQQAYETPMIKQFIHNLPTFNELAPKEKQTLQKIADAMAFEQADRLAAARLAVTPVRHTIRIEKDLQP